MECYSSIYHIKCIVDDVEFVEILALERLLVAQMTFRVCQRQ